jgi:hypothetical protein
LPTAVRKVVKKVAKKRGFSDEEVASILDP